MKTHKTILRIVTAMMVYGAVFSIAQADVIVKGKISRNVYRIPYAASMSINIGGNDYVGHGGSMDSSASQKVCTSAAATACSSDAGCGVVGGK